MDDSDCCDSGRCCDYNKVLESGVRCAAFSEFRIALKPDG